MDGYLRVSRVAGRSGESFISPDLQREQIEAWAKSRGVEIDQWFIDLDQSGGNLDRPQFNEAMVRIESGASDGIAVARIDRFARSLMGALQAIDRIDHAGGSFVSVSEGFDATTPMGRLVLRLMLSLAEFELDRYREQWHDARTKAVGRGVHISAKAPTGYVKNDDGTLSPDPIAAPVIVKAFEMRAGGRPWREIEEMMNASGIHGPYGATNWYRQTIHRVLSNRAYLGHAYSGEIVNPDAHEPIVDRGTFEATQAMTALPPARGEEGPSLLSGLIRCAGCSYSMKPDSQTGRDGQKIRQYTCRRQHSMGTCPAPAGILAERIEGHVVDFFWQRIGDVEVIRTGKTDAIDDATIELAEAEGELASYRDDPRIIGLIGQDAFVSGLEARKIRVDQAREDLALERGKTTRPDRSTLIEVWDGLNTDQRRELLASSIGAVFIMKGRGSVESRAVILDRDQTPSGLPSRGKRRVPLAIFHFPK